MTSFLPTFIESQKALAEANGRTFKLRRRPSLQLVPKGIERMFRTDILRMLRRARQLVDELLVPELERIVAEAGLRGDERDLERHDVLDVSVIVQQIIGPTKLTLSTANLRQAEQLAGQYFNATSTFSRRQTLKQLKGVLGVDAFPSEPQLASMLNGFVAENTSLITSIPDRYLDRVGELVQRRVRAGDRASTIARDIGEQFNVEARRAALIARDQVNKLNGALTRMRQTNLGITQYIWRTSRDERVRETHRLNEGRKFSWNEPPAETGHPGQDINCRCTAEPVIPGVEPDDEDPAEVRAEILAKRGRLREKLKGTRGGRRVARDRPSRSRRARAAARSAEPTPARTALAESKRKTAAAREKLEATKRRTAEIRKQLGQTRAQSPQARIVELEKQISEIEKETAAIDRANTRAERREE